MSVEKRNVLTLLENGQLKTYLLDDQLSWEVGRESINSNPDIKLRSITVSRKHGKFQNINGNWLYVIQFLLFFQQRNLQKTGTPLIQKGYKRLN